jgi:O-antigen ligase
MSLTALVWVAALTTLALLSVTRGVFGFSTYLLTFFMFPQFWWWGDDLPALRWNLLAGIVFIIGAAVHQARVPPRTSPVPSWFTVLLALIALNATFVHVALPLDRSVSEGPYVLLLKFTLLCALIVVALRDRRDLRIAMWSIAIGAAYIGYEVTINDRGSLSGARLEGIGAAGVQNANQLASLMATVLPLIGGLYLTGGWREKIGAVIVAPFVLNVLLLCNSRGAFLASIVGGIVFLLTAARGPARRKALQGLGLGVVALLFLLKDPDITNRFLTVFVDAEERDSSASNRILFWRAALRMIADYPLGAGGDGFSRTYSGRYLRRLGLDLPSRAVHNGYLTEATEWGVQGLMLRLCWLGMAVMLTLRIIRARLRNRDPDAAIIGACLLTALTSLLVSAVFGDFVDEEWSYWIVALIVVYAGVYGAEPASIAGTESGDHMVPATAWQRSLPDAGRRTGTL